MKMSWMMALLFVLAAEPEAGVVNISSYGAYPNDGVDDTAAINTAITSVNPGDTLLFDSGVYDLKTPRDVYRHIYFYYKTGITLQGAVDSAGAPVTTLLRHVEPGNNPDPSRLVNITGGSDITLKNFVMDNTPHLCSSGEITEVDINGTYVKVQVFDGLPLDDGAACYSANAWEADTRDLKAVESLTYGTSPGFWEVVDEPNRIVKLEDSAGLDFTDDVEVGDYMSWHYGVHIGGNEPQIRVDGSKNLTFENLRIPNVINMGVLVGSTDGITLRGITMRPDGNMLQVGPADGIHLSRCSGVISAEALDIAGVRWDGFVVHAPYGAVKEVTSSTELTVRMMVSTSGQTISAGSKLRFLNSLGEITERTVSADAAHQTLDGKSCYEIVVTEALPAFVGVGTNLKIEDISPDSVTLTDSRFENIAGSALILLADNITVSNTVHRKIMYSAGHFGANHTVGIAGENIQVLDSVFDRCGWRAKTSETPGVLTFANLQTTVTNGVLRDVVIEDNVFINQLYDSGDPTIGVADTDGITIKSNLFESVWRGMKFDTSTTSGYQILDNTIVIDNDGNDQTYTEVSGNFGNSSLKGYDESLTRYSSSPGAEAAWEFIAPKSDDYAVYIYKVVHSGSDDNAQILVESNGPTVTNSVDCTAGSSGWHYLGIYSYTGQQSYTISNERQGGYLRADAVMFVQQ